MELEKPQGRLFTNSADLTLTALFNHTFGQLLDFVGWVDSNVAYARKKLLGIEAPQGLLMIGHRERLTGAEVEKLRPKTADASK